MPNWSEILKEASDYAVANPGQAGFDVVRRKYLTLLHEHTGRNVIAYYSGWLSKPNIVGSDINDEDKGGFMSAVYRLDRSLGLDLILHTPGGNIAATQSVVDYLRQMFGNDIRAIVPQIAMSAGTMIACSCKSIVMGLHSNIGPIDPQLRDIPAYGVREEFQRAFREVTADPSKTPIWQAIIGQYRPTFLSQCENAITWSNSFVREQLENVMFSGERDAKSMARSIVRKLSNYSANKSHTRHIHLEECESMGLKIEGLEADPILQERVLSVHHSYSLTLANSAGFKIIENQNGIAFVKQQQIVASQPIQLQQPPPNQPAP